MQLRFLPAKYLDIENDLRDHLASLPGRYDSHFEERVVSSDFYRTVLDGDAVGYGSIWEGTAVTQFVLADDVKHHGTAVYWQFRRLEEVQAAYVPTFDEYFLVQALEDHVELDKAAHLFARSTALPDLPDPGVWDLRLAESDDVGLIRDSSGDFFDPIERRIDASELYATMHHGECAGFGLIERSTLYPGTASIGMFTIERFRNRGDGTATIRLLIEQAASLGLEPIAGCANHNHFSKRTLERAGLFSPTRVLRLRY